MCGQMICVAVYSNCVITWISLPAIVHSETKRVLVVPRCGGLCLFTNHQLQCPTIREDAKKEFPTPKDITGARAGSRVSPESANTGVMKTINVEIPVY